MRLITLIAALSIAMFLIVQAFDFGRQGVADDGLEEAVARVAEATAFKQRHQSKGIDCAACHGPELDFAVLPTVDVCLSCHESYEAVAELTGDVVPNPHYSHMGEGTCTDCHSEHLEPRLSCNQCHVFEMDVP